MNNMQAVLSFATILVPLVISLVELLKITINMPKRIVPLLSFLIGIGIGFISTPFTELELVLRLWAGGLAGLSATGLFELAFNKHEGMTKSINTPPVNENVKNTAQDETQNSENKEGF